jgi:di/tricarboxylate transporter
VGAAIVFVVLVAAVVVFATEVVDMGVFSLAIMAVLVATQAISPQQALAGFVSSAVVMIAGVMLLSGALLHNGSLELLTRRLMRMPLVSQSTVGALLIGVVNVVSSLINNVAATALFVPVAESAAQRFGVNRSKWLMPVAFASMTGGMCTLIGTSTNVAVSGALPQYDLAPLTMFELAPVGVLVAAVAMVYLLFVAPRLLPLPAVEREPVDAYNIREFLFEVAVLAEGPVAGKTLAEGDLERRYGLVVVAISRPEERIDAPGGDQRLQAGDVLLVESTLDYVRSLPKSSGLELHTKSLEPLPPLVSRGVHFVEATISPNSPLVGETLQQANFRQVSGLTVLAIHRREERLVDKVGKIPLRAGDVLLIFGRDERIRRLGDESPSLVLDESAVRPRFNKKCALTSAVVFGGSIAAGTTGWLAPPTAFITGGGLLLALRCLPLGKIAEYVNLRFLLMIAAMSSIGTGMEVTGGAGLAADAVRTLVGHSSPLVLMGAFFICTVLLTQPLNNAAAALVMLPVVLHAATDLGVNPRTYAVAITIAASCSFISPFEPACLLVYSRGSYRFFDFVRVGAPLTVAVFVMCLFLIPILWPL